MPMGGPGSLPGPRNPDIALQQGVPMVTVTITMDSQVPMPPPVGYPVVMVAITMQAQVHRPTLKGSQFASITMKAEVHKPPA